MCRPVEMWGCVPASMSGLTRTATRARMPSRLRGAIDALQLACRLGVDGLEAELHGPLDFVGRFADAAEDDVRRREASAHRQLDLADGIGVDGAAGLAQQANDGERRVRLHRVVDAVRMRRERLVELAVRLADRRRRCRRRAACRGRARCASSGTPSQTSALSSRKNPNTAKHLTSRSG